MILLDADVVLIDCKYTTDTRRPVNRAALDRLRADGYALGMMAHATWEVVGVLSYGTPTAQIPRIPDALRTAYGLVIIPDPAAVPGYAGCSYHDILALMTTKMNLGDAVQAAQINTYLPTADLLLTWNVKHFRGRTPVPVLTPQEWLLQQPPAGPTP